MTPLGKQIGFCACVILFCVRGVSAQDVSSGSWFLRGALTSPHILPSSPFESSPNGQGEPVNWVPDLTVEIGRQTNGTQLWHHLYGLPSYGVGFSVARFQSGAQHGQPLEAYAFFSWPLVRLSERVDMTTDFGMGLSWNWQEMNEPTQPNRTVLGSDLNARIDWGVYLRYMSTPRMSVYTGLDFTHRSNGGLVQPDLGINVLGPKVAVQYNFRSEPASRPAMTPPPFGPTWELLIGGAGGVKNVVERAAPVSRQDFGVFHATAGLQQHFYRFGKITGGTDLTYDGATGAKRELVDGIVKQSRADPGERWAVGAYGGYEHVIGRFGAFVDVGYTVARGSEVDSSLPRLYQRFGWRYQFNDRLWGTVAIRSFDGHKADFLECGAGYRIRLSGPDARGLAGR
jgi:lipid A 3-O-deacylase PagL